MMEQLKNKKKLKKDSLCSFWTLLSQIIFYLTIKVEGHSNKPKSVLKCYFFLNCFYPCDETNSWVQNNFAQFFFFFCLYNILGISNICLVLRAWSVKQIDVYACKNSIDFCQCRTIEYWFSHLRVCKPIRGIFVKILSSMLIINLSWK